MQFVYTQSETYLKTCKDIGSIHTKLLVAKISEDFRVRMGKKRKRYEKEH